MHSFKIIRNGTLIRDFVPVAVGDKPTSSSEHGMVDMEAVRRGTGQVFYPYRGGFVWSYDTRLTVEATSEQLTYTVYLRYPYTNSGIRMGSKIDWGDGTIDSVDGVEHPSHTYAEPGEYQVHFMINYQNGRLSVTNETNDANAKMVKSLDSYSGQQALPDNFLRYASNVTVASSVLKDIRYLGDCSFNECPSLTLPVLPKNLMVADGGVFRGCPDVAFTSLPSNMRYIGSYAFASTKVAIKSIPREVTYIGSSAFEYCGDMPLASMGDKVVTLGWYAFRDCSKTTMDHLSPLITSLGRWTFAGCAKLAISELPPSLAGAIGTYALAGCSNITVSSIPEGVTSTDSRAFNGCEKIPSMVIPASMNSLDYQTFAGCTIMRYAIFKGKPSTVYNNIFERCPALTDIYVPWYEGDVADAPWGATNATVHYLLRPGTPASDEVLYLAGSKVTLYSDTNVASHTFSDGKGVIKYTSSLTTMPDTLRGTPVISVALPSGVTSIAAHAFHDCTSLVAVEPPASLRSIGVSAFTTCSLLQIAPVNNNVTSIGDNAFHGCGKLVIGSLPSGLTSIGASVFLDCNNLELSALPSGLQGTIGNWSFANCYKIAINSVPEGVTKLDTRAFQNCDGIQTLTLPSTMTNVGYLSLGYCDALASVTFQSTPTSIDAACFNGSSALTDIYVPWAEGAVANAPWGATNATIHYNHQVS